MAGLLWNMTTSTVLLQPAGSSEVTCCCKQAVLVLLLSTFKGAACLRLHLAPPAEPCVFLQAAAFHNTADTDAVVHSHNRAEPTCRTVSSLHHGMICGISSSTFHHGSSRSGGSSISSRRHGKAGATAPSCDRRYMLISSLLHGQAGKMIYNLRSSSRSEEITANAVQASTAFCCLLVLCTLGFAS